VTAFAAVARFQAEMITGMAHPRPLADWGGISTDAWTAVGTIALAAVTFITLVITIVISWRSNKQLRAERGEAQAAEQLAEAYAVQVAGDTTTLVVNHGKYTITDVDAWLTLAKGIRTFPKRERVLGLRDLDAELTEGVTAQLDGTTPDAHSDILAPWDAGLRFVVQVTDIDPATHGTLAGAYPVVRWTDRWGNRWEHCLGRARKAESPPSGRGKTVARLLSKRALENVRRKASADSAADELPPSREGDLSLACCLTLLPAGFLLGLVSCDGFAHVVAGGRVAVLRSGRASGAGFAGFRRAGQAGQRLVDAPEPGPDSGRGEPAGSAGLLPGQADVGGEVADEPELGVAGDDQPGPPVGGGGVAQLGPGPAEYLLEEPDVCS
jgi:hypothetical protein